MEKRKMENNECKMDNGKQKMLKFDKFKMKM